MMPEGVEHIEGVYACHWRTSCAALMMPEGVEHN